VHAHELPLNRWLGGHLHMISLSIFNWATEQQTLMRWSNLDIILGLSID
jgi:hypothetical protein